MTVSACGPMTAIFLTAALDVRLGSFATDPSDFAMPVNVRFAPKAYLKSRGNMTAGDDGRTTTIVKTANGKRRRNSGGALFVPQVFPALAHPRRFVR
jgi:hypothetical protein